MSCLFFFSLAALFGRTKLLGSTRNLDGVLATRCKSRLGNLRLCGWRAREYRRRYTTFTARSRGPPSFELLRSPIPPFTFGDSPFRLVVWALLDFCAGSGCLRLQVILCLPTHAPNSPLHLLLSRLGRFRPPHLRPCPLYSSTTHSSSTSHSRSIFVLPAFLDSSDVAINEQFSSLVVEGRRGIQSQRKCCVRRLRRTSKLRGLFLTPTEGVFPPCPSI
ncbi:hypothetical protein R3P38DRAFT_334902 [Favolaschia claudopus]|uniref:Secreted protein n=1 Tax=Favolaschia claudopus TaxID=2862362 RepID=A0AAV9ZL09_9AGAR